MLIPFLGPFLRPFLALLAGGVVGALVARMVDGFASSSTLPWSVGLFLGGVAGGQLAGRFNVWPFRLAGWVAGLAVGVLVAELLLPR